MTEAADAQFYPWQAPLKARIARLHGADTLPHALLLSGPRHLGKRAFAAAVAGAMLCRRPLDGDRCGECEDCLLFTAGTHPDYRRIFPEERSGGKSTGEMNERKLIVIDQIRDLIEWANQTAQRGGMKTVVIHPAEQMNVNAANALLKCPRRAGGRNPHYAR
ncbi:MAG: hypothetical protein U5O39_17460 [Gammaproteobacteria bacterium]|nr:hypothetical protein [Gammaproteobacteria bacterium]